MLASQLVVGCVCRYCRLVLWLCRAQDWDSHWQECDGSGGTTPAEALEQCMEFMAGRFERGLSLGQSTPKKNLDGERKEEETDSYQWPAPRRVWGLYADPSKGKFNIMCCGYHADQADRYCTIVLDPQTMSPSPKWPLRDPSRETGAGRHLFSRIYRNQRGGCSFPSTGTVGHWRGRWRSTSASMTTPPSATQTER